MFNLKKLPFPLLWIFASTYMVAGFYLRLRNPIFVDKVDVPVQGGYGIDLQAILEWTRATFHHFGSYFDEKFTPNVYPPFHIFLYSPLLIFSEKWGYVVFSFLSITALIAMLAFALRLGACSENKSKSNQWALLCGFTFALVAQSYPVLFCLERGNSDIINGALCAGFLYFLFRDQRKLAMGLLTLGAQIKVFPAFLAVFFVLKRDFKSLIQFVAVNAALMFIFGWRGVQFFLHNISKIQNEPYLWQGNHSLKSGLRFYFESLPPYATQFAAGALLVLFTICCAVYFFKTKDFLIDRKIVGLVGMSFLLMGLLPAHSHDYKLVMQIVPFLVLAVFENAKSTLIGDAIAVFTALLFIPPHYYYPRTAILLVLFFGYFWVFLRPNSKQPNEGHT